MTDDAATYRRFVTERSLEPFSIGGVHAHLNPTSFSYHTEAVHVEIPTLAGVAAQRFANRPPIISLEGFTGIAGREGLDRWKKFRPLPGVQQKLIAFKFPNRFGDRVLWCYLNSFEDHMDSEMHLYNSFRCELLEMGQPSAPSGRTLSATTGNSVAAILRSGPPPLAGSRVIGFDPVTGNQIVDTLADPLGNQSAAVNPAYNTRQVGGYELRPNTRANADHRFGTD